MTTKPNHKNFFLSSFFQYLKPEPKLNLSEWADKHRILTSRSSSEPGRWRTSRTPYLKEIMDCLSSDHPAREIIFMKGSQVGGTEVGLNWLGYIIDHVPAPTMLVQPTVEMAKRNSKQRIEPLIEGSPRLNEKVKEKRARDSGNTVLQKDFPGGTLVITGANSAVGLRSLPARYVFFDECDAAPLDCDGEGSPIDLAKARSRTFSKRKFFLVSTPTIEGESQIAENFKKSNQKYFHVPCPLCKHLQKLVFTQLKFEKTNPSKVSYECENCGGRFEERHKTEMLNQGIWVSENPSSKIEGFHLSSLYSPLGWYSWEDIIKDWLEAQKDTDKLKTFINTVLGETWKEKGEAPEWKRLWERRNDYKIGTVPNGGLFLTAGADVQKDRIEVEIVAWGRNQISWSVDYVVLPGNTADEKVWKDLDLLLTQKFPKTDNPQIKLGIRAIGIDTGFNSQEVYQWCRQYPGTFVYAMKGDDSQAIPISIPSKVDVTIKGKKYRRGLNLWQVGVNVLKSELYGRLKLSLAEAAETPNGFCFFPQYAEEYFRQLTAEQVMIRRNPRGFTKQEWEKTRERNEALDCRVYARAASIIIGYDRFTEKNYLELEQQIGLDNTIQRIDNGAAQQSPVKTRRASNFW